MAVLREAEVSEFLKRRAGKANGLLIYGGNPSGIDAISQAVLKALAGEDTVRRLEASSLRDDGAALDDAFRALSLLGGRQLIVVAGCDETHAKYLVPTIKSETPGNFVLLLAGALGKSSLLRKTCEAAASFYCLPVYDDKPSEVMARVGSVLSEAKMKLSGDAAARFAALCGTDRALALNEAAKLVLYCLGQTVIEAEDVEACCGDQASYDADQLIDAVLGGDGATADRMMATMGEGGWRTVLPLFSSHLARLTALRLEADVSGDVEAAIGNARPMIFFGRKPAISRQLRALTVPNIVGFQRRLEASVLQSRRIPDLGEQIVARMLLAMAADARKLARG